MGDTMQNRTAGFGPAAADALPPGARAEDRLMVETSDSPTRQVKAGVQEGYERVQEVTGEHLEHAGRQPPKRMV